MQIDWFTFGAQIVNFLILIGLLKRFLYAPILAAMDAREARISSQLNEAREQREEAEAEKETYRSLQEDLEQARQQELAEAEQEAQVRRQELLQEAREEVGHLEHEWREALERERESFLRELSERAVTETIAVARRALRDLADADLEKQAVEVFLERLRTLSDETRAALTEALRSNDHGAVVHSAFVLSEAHQAQIRERLDEQLGGGSDVAFDADAEVGFGVELRIGERKVAWSLDSYLDDLKARVRERLDAELRKGAADVTDETVGPPESTNEK
jgi:F-type H+-transporting ATPase subunit b